MLSEIDVEVAVAVGAQSHPAICRANGLVAMSIEGATFRTIGGAAHFMISTHPAQVAELIADTVSRAEMPQPCPAASMTADQPARACCCQ